MIKSFYGVGLQNSTTNKKTPISTYYFEYVIGVFAFILYMRNYLASHETVLTEI